MLIFEGGVATVQQEVLVRFLIWQFGEFGKDGRIKNSPI